MAGTGKTVGRRERKKTETRSRVQRAALDLFEEHGLTKTSIEQISELADVSTTTFFRYFRTKDETVAHNAFTPLFLDALRDQPEDLTPLAAVRMAVSVAGESMSDDVWNYERRRQQFVLNEPNLRGPSMMELRVVVERIARIVAGRSGLPQNHPDVTAFAGAVLGVFTTVVLDQELTVDNYTEKLDRALAFLGTGLRLPDGE